MKSRMKFRLIGSSMVLMFLTAAATVPLSAEARHGEGRIFKRLNLTEEQRTKLDEIRKTNASRTKDLRKKMKASREKLQAAMEADASESDLKKAHKEVQEVRAELDELRFGSILTIRKVLTPEQRKKFGELKGKGRHGKVRFMGQDEE